MSRLLSFAASKNKDDAKEDDKNFDFGNNIFAGSVMQSSTDNSSSSVEVNDTNLKEFLDKIPLFDEFNKHKVLYEQKQQELFKYFGNEFQRMLAKIKELNTFVESKSDSTHKTISSLNQEETTLWK